MGSRRTLKWWHLPLRPPTSRTVSDACRAWSRQPEWPRASAVQLPDVSAPLPGADVQLPHGCRCPPAWSGHATWSGGVEGLLPADGRGDGVRVAPGAERTSAEHSAPRQRWAQQVPTLSQVFKDEQEPPGGAECDLPGLPKININVSRCKTSSVCPLTHHPTTSSHTLLPTKEHVSCVPWQD